MRLGSLSLSLSKTLAAAHLDTFFARRAAFLLTMKEHPLSKNMLIYNRTPTLARRAKNRFFALLGSATMRFLRSLDCLFCHIFHHTIHFLKIHAFILIDAFTLFKNKRCYFAVSRPL